MSVEEYDGILLRSLQNAGVSIPINVASIRDLNPGTLISISAQCLNLLDGTVSFPSSFPDSLVDKFKICTDMALAVKRLGFIGDITYYKFLYPSEEDLYKLVSFLVERLCDSSNGFKIPDLKDSNSKRKLEGDGATENLEDSMEKADKKELDLNHPLEKFDDLSLHSVEAESSDSKIVHASFDKSGTPNFIEDKLTGAPAENILGAEEEGVSGRESEETVAQKDDEHIQKVTPSWDKLSETSHDTKILKNKEKVLMKEVTARTLELQKLDKEFELLKAAAEMAFDDQHPIDFYLEQLNKQIDSSKCNIVESESQWDGIKKPLEEKKKSLEEFLYANMPGSQEKLQMLREVEREKQSILSEIRRREEEYSKLSMDIEKQPKLPSRASYVERIKEITKNSRKQDADVERILKETRELQLESNSMQERLHRTYAVLDEIVFREAKKDPVGRQAYRRLTSIHECFEQIAEKILLLDRIRREVADHEKKLTAMASRSLNVDKLQADLDAIAKENKYLDQQIQE